jgi:hypothetical protein
MIIVNLIDQDDDTVTHTYAVGIDAEPEHSLLNDTDTRYMFEKAWEENLAMVKATNPEEWMLSAVITILRAKGWNLIEIDALELQY